MEIEALDKYFGYTEKGSSFETEIRAGDPICYLMPLSERPVKVASKLVSEQEFNWIAEKRNKKFTFIDKWKKNRKLKKFN